MGGAGFRGEWCRFRGKRSKFPGRVVLVMATFGAGLILGRELAPPERTECRNAWQALAIFWNLLRMGREPVPLVLGTSTTHTGNLLHWGEEPAPKGRKSRPKYPNARASGHIRSA